MFDGFSKKDIPGSEISRTTRGRTAGVEESVYHDALAEYRKGVEQARNTNFVKFVKSKEDKDPWGDVYEFAKNADRKTNVLACITKPDGTYADLVLKDHEEPNRTLSATYQCLLNLSIISSSKYLTFSDSKPFPRRLQAKGNLEMDSLTTRTLLLLNPWSNLNTEVFV